ncbi:MAG TPA: hypothetical protein V6C76_10170 [Drouetiella sp.]
MHLTKTSIASLRSRVSSAIRRADEISVELCPGSTRLRVAADITGLADLMITDAVEYLGSAGHTLEQVEKEMPKDGSVAENLAPNTIALIARAEQKVMHAIDQLNRAQQMVDGDRSIWGDEIRHGSLWDK